MARRFIRHSPTFPSYSGAVNLVRSRLREHTEMLEKNTISNNNINIKMMSITIILLIIMLIIQNAKTTTDTTPSTTSNNNIKDYNGHRHYIP